MQTWTVTAVEDYPHKSGVPCWSVLYRKPDGTVHQQVMQQSIVDWRMAEYGVDLETAIDIVLHEPFAAPLRDVRQVPALFSADTVQEARDAHLALIQRVKQEVVQAVEDKSSQAALKAARGSLPLDVMRNGRRATEAEMAMMRQDVLNERARVRGQGPRSRADVPAPSVPEVPVDPAMVRQAREMEQR